MPKDENDDFAGLPHNLQTLIRKIGFPEFTELDEDEARIYDLVRHGRCMTCERPLGKDSNFIISRYGIVGGYCSGICHSDMAIVGWLQEQHGDIAEKIEFRKNTVDGTAIEEAPDTLGDDPAFENTEGE